MREPHQSYQKHTFKGRSQLAETPTLPSPTTSVTHPKNTALKPPTLPLATCQLVTPAYASDVIKPKIATSLHAPTHHGRNSTELSRHNIVTQTRKHKLHNSCTTKSPEIGAVPPRENTARSGKENLRHQHPNSSRKRKRTVPP